MECRSVLLLPRKRQSPRWQKEDAVPASLLIRRRPEQLRGCHRRHRHSEQYRDANRSADAHRQPSQRDIVREDSQRRRCALAHLMVRSIWQFLDDNHAWAEIRNVRCMEPGTSLNEANLRQRATTSCARFVVTVVGTDFVPPIAAIHTSSFSDNLRGHPAEKDETNENLPSISISVSRDRKMIADHEKNHRDCHESIVFGAQLGLRAQRSVKLFPGRCRRDHFSLRGKNAEPDICRHDGSENRTDVNVGGTAAEKMH